MLLKSKTKIQDLYDILCARGVSSWQMVAVVLMKADRETAVKEDDNKKCI